MQSQFQIYLEKVINEEFVASDRIRNSFVKIYKNPKTLEGMKAWIRGVVLRSGDLYVFNQEYDDLHDPFIHADVVKWMNENIELNSGYDEGDNPLDYINEFLTVNRSGVSNIFVLAESYDLEEIGGYELRKMQEYVKSFKVKNPTLELVVSADEEQRSNDASDRQRAND